MWKLTALLLGLALLLACESSSVPTAAPEPTPADSTSETFWDAVEFYAHLPRTSDYKRAKDELIVALFPTFNERLSRIEALGINTENDYPYCINGITGTHALAGLIRAESPKQAGQYVSTLLTVISWLPVDMKAAQSVGRAEWSTAESVRKCDEIDRELSAAEGISPRR